MTTFAVPRSRGPEVAREHQFFGRHPDPLPVQWGGPGWVLIDDPMAYPIQRGDPCLGFEGDDRLALYLNVAKGRWGLWRLEGDSQYRLVTSRATIETRGPELVASLIAGLVAHDTRRGFNAHEHVVKQNTLVDEAVAKHWDARHSDLNDKLRWGLKRDGADNYVTGA